MYQPFTHESLLKDDVLVGTNQITHIKSMEISQSKSSKKLLNLNSDHQKKLFPFTE